MEGRTSGLEEFLKQVGQFQQDCQRSKDLGHRFLITGRSLALHSIERFMPHNLERVEIQPMDDELQNRWFANWGKLVGAEPTYLMGMLQDKRLPDQLRELAREPLLLYLIAAMHRDDELTLHMFAGAEGIRAKILLYEKTLDWVLTKQRPEWLNHQLTVIETEGLRRILAEAALCVVQSGGECAAMEMVKERIKDSDAASDLIQQAQEKLGNDALKNALAAFYLQPVKGDKGGSVEFAHKSFSEFLFAQRLKKSLEEWTESGRKGEEYLVKNAQMAEEIYDLLGYGGLTPEIVEYLMGLLTANDEFLPEQLFKRLQYFYLRWCEGEFIDIPEETLPQKKMRQLQKQGIQLGQRQVDVYAGLNVMILLLELNRYAQSRDDLKDKIAFYPCGQKNTESFDEARLLRIIGYSHCISVDAFSKIVGIFIRGVNLSGINLRRVDLTNTILSHTNLSEVNLRYADLRCANLNGAILHFTDLCGADLFMAALNGADLRGANLADVNLSSGSTNYQSRKGGQFSEGSCGADLTRANLKGAILQRAVLRGAVLRGAHLRGAHLRGAHLRGAHLRGAHLSGAHLSGANLEHVSWNEETKWGDVEGLETAVNVPEALKQQLGLG